MNYISIISEQVCQVLKKEFDFTVLPETLLFNETRKEFVGDTTLVIFPFIKQARKSPQELGDVIGRFCQENVEFIQGFNLIKGFLNFEFTEEYWLNIYEDIKVQTTFQHPTTDKTVLVEFSSPNTNKPLHLGHVRNILLGWSTAQILSAAGHNVIKTQIINDRGIAVCKSMLAWSRFSNDATPQSTGKKSDHFVGDYYVMFETKFKQEYKEWQDSEIGLSTYESLKKEDQDLASFFKAYKNKYFNEFSILGADAKKMLIQWENGDEEIRRLWKKMNGWVYAGFEETYDNLGVSFDSYYYESETYTLGKDIIDTGLSDNIFYKKEDGSVWIDLEDVGLDQKLVLRSDGTSVYMTQDIGTARLRYEQTNADGMVYVVADEQDYHFKALFSILSKLNEPYHNGLHHLSYGMVDLPSGRMKSREGTVVDADVLMEEVIGEARKNGEERGETSDFSKEERENIYKMVGEAALKFFILKVNPKKRMIFNPADSVDMQGATGPYVQNAYVRVQSISRKAADLDLSLSITYSGLEEVEKDIVKKLSAFMPAIKQSAAHYDPSIITIYCYDLAKLYHKFYHDVRILGADSDDAKAFRVNLGINVAKTLKAGFKLLGIGMPEKM